MIKTSKINSLLFLLFLLLFCFPFVFPQFELMFILTQFGVIIPLYLFLNLFTINAFGKFQIIIYFSLFFLMLLGLPGSIVGWMAMLCVGYLFGIRTTKSYEFSLKELKPFIVCSVIMCLWILRRNFINPFDYELLSDFFEKSSINTVPILMVCTTNIYCSVLYYWSHTNEKNKSFAAKKEFKLLILLLVIALSCVIIFDFRSGFGIFILSILIILQFLKLKFNKGLFAFLSFFLIYLFYYNDFSSFLVKFLSQGGEDLLSVSVELSDGALRFDRIINFWKITYLSKSNFSTWSDNFSVSGMSDFIAALFPLSILFLIIPFLGYFRFFKRTFKKNIVNFLIISSCLLSSLLISILQPDFYSFFSFFAISSMIYFGEKKLKRIQ